MTATSFDNWLRAQANRRDPIGDLARDYADDCKAHGITAMTPSQLRASTATQRASEEARQTFKAAELEWNQRQYLAGLRSPAHNLPLTNAAGEIEGPLENLAAERE